MRIIGGKYQGKRFSAPKDITARPTTDFAKEALFNILRNKIDVYDLEVLDLFAGIGGVSFEFASRDCSVVSVEQNPKCFKHLLKLATDWDADVQVTRADVFKFLKNRKGKFDLVFADPPYDLTDKAKIHSEVFENGWLNDEGMFILEHSKRESFSDLPFFIEERTYGAVRFSFYQKNNEE